MNEIGEEIWRECEALGEETVRQHIAMGIYNDGKAALAGAWLEHMAARVTMASQIEANSIARDASLSAKAASEAASRQARAAERANSRATIAIVISAISIMVTIVIAIVTLLHLA